MEMLFSEDKMKIKWEFCNSVDKKERAALPNTFPDVTTEDDNSPDFKTL